MADRFPLIVDSATGTVKELPSTDNLNLSGSEIIGINSITFANGTTLSGSTGIGSTLRFDSDISITGLVVGRGTNGSVGFATLGVSEVASNIILGAGNILSKFIGFSTGGGTPNIGIGNSVLINFVGSGSTIFESSSELGNIAIGHEALQHVTEGGGNVALGRGALFSTKTGGSNTAIGDASMVAAGVDPNIMPYGGPELILVHRNTAVGSASLFRVRSSLNTAVGAAALLHSSTGHGSNTAIGYESLRENTTGGTNTGVGASCLVNSTTGINNTGIGFSAGFNLTTGSNNVVLGFNALVSVATTSNQVVLGDSNITSLRCNVTTISAVSDERDKKNITNLPIGLEFINALRPVKFEWNRRDGSMIGIQEAGFIAQELDTAQENANAEEYLKLVLKDNPEKLEASPGKLIPILVKAIQELKSELDGIKEHLGL